MNKKFHMTPAKLTAALFAVILLTVPIVTIALPETGAQRKREPHAGEVPGYR